MKKILSVLALAIAVAIPQTLTAQFQPVVSGTYEGASADRAVWSAGADIYKGTLGWSPRAGVFAFYQDENTVLPGQNDTGEIEGDAWGVVPTIGIQHRDETSTIGIDVGYQFADSDGFPVNPTMSYTGSSESVITAVSGQMANRQLPVQMSGSAVYNWDDSFAYGRAHVAGVVTQLGANSSVLLGVEGAARGFEGYDAWQVAPTLTLRVGSGLQVLGAYGYRTEDGFDDSGYGKVSVSYMPNLNF